MLLPAYPGAKQCDAVPSNRATAIDHGDAPQRVGRQVRDHRVRERALVVPELHSPRIVNAEKRGDRRRGDLPVARRDVLPHHEHAQVRAVLCERVLERGGPPQTERSGRREQDEDARAIGLAIEDRSQRRQVAPGDQLKRRLWRRRHVRGQELDRARSGRAQGGCEDDRGDEPSIEGRQIPSAPRYP